MLVSFNLPCAYAESSFTKLPSITPSLTLTNSFYFDGSPLILLKGNKEILYNKLGGGRRPENKRKNSEGTINKADEKQQVS